MTMDGRKLDRLPQTVDKLLLTPCSCAFLHHRRESRKLKNHFREMAKGRFISDIAQHISHIEKVESLRVTLERWPKDTLSVI